MLKWFIGSSLRYRYLVMALAAGLMFFGVQQLSHTQIDVFPEFAPPRVEVQTPSLGLSATEVESLVTIPLEQSLAGIPGLDELRSKSVEGLSSVLLIFDRGTDLLTARQLVSERIAVIAPTLPTWASPPFMIQPLSSTSRVMKIGLTSGDPEIDLIDMSMVSYWTIRARLLRVPGVANVPIWGERLEMLQVQVDPNRLREHQVALDTVMTATADALETGLLKYSESHVIGKGGWIEENGTRLSVRHVAPHVTAEDLALVPIQTRTGATLQLQDVADLVRDHQPLLGDGVINDGPGLMLIVEKLPWANTLDVTRGVEEAMTELEPALDGIVIDAEIFRPATFVEESISNLSTAILIGALLMILMLSLFLYEWRTALISVVAIPLSLVAAGLVLHARGATINTMILAGMVIALGDIVDDAIIDIENVVRRLRQHRKEGGSRSTARVILDASLEVRSAIVYATLLEIVAIVPIFALTGLSGAFFRPLAASYALALLASMFVALTVTPALSLIFFRNPKSLQHRESPLVPPLKRLYLRALRPIVDRPQGAYGAVATVSIVGVLLVPLLGQSLLPDFKERDFLMHWLTRPGTGQVEMVRITEEVNRELLTIPGVRNAGSHIGQALLMDEVVGIDFGENWVSVDPSVDYDDTVAAIQETVDGYPGLYRDVQTYLKERIREVLTGSSEPITIRVFGSDLQVLRDQADKVNEILAGIPGVTENHVEHQLDIPQVKVEVDLEAAKQYGLKPGDVRRASAQLIAGEEAGDLFREGKAYDVQVWSTPETRRSLTDVKNLLLDTPNGQYVMLQDVADVSVVPVPNKIEHQDLSRSLDVGANLDGTRDLGSVVADLEAGLAQIEWPEGFRAELLGEFTERQAASGRMWTFALVAAAGVFLLLQASFTNGRLALLAFLTLPIALVGGIVAATVSGGELSLGSLVGFFTVLGIVARNGIMLISHYQHLELEEGMAFGKDLVLRGAQERLIPISMTVLTTGLALTPLLIGGEIPGQEIEYPMAIVILGGLITATLLNLFVVPSLYLRFAKRRATSRAPAAAGIAGALVLVLSACGSTAALPEAPSLPTLVTTTDAPVTPSVIETSLCNRAAGPGCVFDHGNFDNPTVIDNEWLPMVPGTQLIYEGTTNEDNQLLEHQVIITVTDLTKVIDGIETVVSWDLDFSQGELVEAELAFFAQDNDGNVWRMGEHPEEYEAGAVVDAPTWLAGVDGALAGVSMLGDPVVGSLSYSQGLAAAVEFIDRGTVHAVGQDTCVEFACFADVLVIAEFNVEEAGANQLKYFAPGIGNVRVDWSGTDETQEELELVEIRLLEATELAEARAAALELESHAYRISPNVYGTTQPAR